MTPKTPLARSPRRHRLSVTSRTLAATFGAYALSTLTAAFLALVLPLPGEEPLKAGTLVSFVVLPAAALWVFAARTAWRAWLGLLVPGIMLAAAVWVLRGGLS